MELCYLSISWSMTNMWALWRDILGIDDKYIKFSLQDFHTADTDEVYSKSHEGGQHEDNAT
jgi:hypothetical protein